MIIATILEEYNMVNNTTLDDVQGLGERPAEQVGAFVYYSGDLKKAYEFSRDNPDSVDAPFSNVSLKTPYSWTSGKQADDITYDLEITDKDFGNKGGAVTIKMNDGWQAAFLLRTENFDYFEDNISGSAIIGDWDIDNEGRGIDKLPLLTIESPIWVQGDAEFKSGHSAFILNGDYDDYLSADIDSQYSTIGQFRVKINGNQYYDNTEMDDDLFIKMIWLRRWDGGIPAESDELFDSGDLVITPEDLDANDTGNNNGNNNNNNNGNTTDEEEDNSSMLWILGLGFVALVAIGFVTMKGE
jgi:hypothetical protein